MNLETSTTKITINGQDVSNMKVNRVSNCLEVLRLIKKNGSVSRNCGIPRLAARIYDLRNKMNYKINCNMVYSKGEKYAVYTMDSSSC